MRSTLPVVCRRFERPVSGGGVLERELELHP